MSLFLGPIHHWLYRKIRLQEELITTLAEQEGAKSGDSGKYENFVNRELRPLEELIDTDNIHGWLQARIHDAEGRYAALVSAILKEDSGALPRIKEEVFAFGASNAVEADASPAEAYRYYGDNLVNGMPCDHVDRVTVQAEDHISWTLDQDLHGEFWIEAGQSPALYYELRLEEMRGMLSGTALTLTMPSEMSYELRAKA